jgi:hypothetical protein
MLDVQTPMRPNRPHIPSITNHVKERRDNNKRFARTSSVSPALPPDYRAAIFVAASAPSVAVSPRPVRFGERLSTSRRRSPQEENVRAATIFSEALILLGRAPASACRTGRLPPRQPPSSRRRGAPDPRIPPCGRFCRRISDHRPALPLDPRAPFRLDRPGSAQARGPGQTARPNAKECQP